MPDFHRFAENFAGLTGTVRAGCWIAASAISYALMISIVRKVAPGIHVFEIVFFRSLFAIVFMIPWISRQGLSALHTPKIGLLGLRGLGAFIASSCLFHAVTLMPLGEMMAISFSRPIFGSIAAILFLGEVASGRRWSAILVGFAGALIIIRPGFQVLNVGTIFVLIAISAQVMNTIIIKYVSRSTKPDTIALFHGLFITPMALIPTLFVWTTPDAEQFMWLMGAGATSMLVQRTLMRGFAATDATMVLAFNFIRLPTAALAGFVFFAEVPEIWVWIGGGVIFASSILLARRENALERGSAEPTRSDGA
jgi:drug/metabolite transporter (DMT)-like permease